MAAFKIRMIAYGRQRARPLTLASPAAQPRHREGKGWSITSTLCSQSRDAAILARRIFNIGARYVKTVRRGGGGRRGEAGRGGVGWGAAPYSWRGGCSILACRGRLPSSPASSNLKGCHLAFCWPPSSWQASRRRPRPPRPRPRPHLHPAERPLLACVC